MKIALSFDEYISFLSKFANLPLTLNRLTLPFGIISNAKASDTLLVGHILDDLASRFSHGDMIDFLDVTITAYDFGHEPAGDFLDDAHQIIARFAHNQPAAILQ